MFKVTEKKNLIIALIALCMVAMPMLAQAGGHGGMGGGMGGSMGMSNTSSTYYTYPSTTRLQSAWPTNYSTYTNPYRYTSALYPNTYSYGNYYTPQYSYGGLSPYNFGQTAVTGKDYTVEQSFTQYVPGGEITTTVGEETETSTFPTYNSLSPYSYNYGLGTNYFGNAYNYGYGLNTLSPYSYGTGFGGWPYY